MLAAAENALIAALKNHRDIKRVLRTVASLPKMPLQALLKRYATDAPALYVVPGAFRVEDDNLHARFTVVGVVRNGGGQDKARKGDGIAIGCDHLLQLAARAIHAHRIGPCGWSLTEGEMLDDDLFDSAGIAAVEMTFAGSAMPIDADWAIGELDKFLQFHGDVDTRPMASPEQRAQWLQEPPVLSPSAPDAQLDVQLPGAT